MLTALLDRPPEAAKEKNKHGRYPLHCLCSNGKVTVEMLTALLDRPPRGAKEKD